MANAKGFEISAGQNAIITGAASGIGLELAHELAARGVNVALVDIDEASLDVVCAELIKLGVQVFTRVVDISDEDQVLEAARAIGESFGHIQLLFNNAGMEMSGPVTTLPMRDWRRVFDVNVFGIVHGLKHFLPLLQEHGEAAHVVNTASSAGFWTNPALAMGAYGATKYAAIAISEALEIELQGTPVGVSVLCPGAVATAIATRSKHASQQLKDALALGSSPQLAAQLALEGVERGDFFIFTPNAIEDAIGARHARVLAALHRVPGGGAD